jgi:hypothetical protein
VRRIPPFQANRTPGTTEDPDLDARFRALEARHVELDRYLGVLIGQVAAVAAPPVVEGAGTSEGGGSSSGSNVASGTVDGELLRWNDTDQEWEPADGVLMATKGTLTFEGAIVIDPVIYAQITGDTVPRFKMGRDGKLAWGSGSAGRDVNLYRSAAHVLASDDNIALVQAGRGFQIKEGANAKMGQAVLVGGTVTVNTTAVAANSRIFPVCAVVGGTQGMLSVGTIVAGTSFVINSSNGADTSTINWIILDPA